MWNASAYVGQMLASIVAQSYQNWRVILIDDVSNKEHVFQQKGIIETWQGVINRLCLEGQIEVIWNDEKKWEVANVLHGISMCDDEDIICRIDADDALCDLDALMIVNSVYEQTRCEVAWSMHRWGFSDRNISGPLPPNADPFKHSWVTSHLKTFRKRLINGIPYENFTNMNGDLVRRCGDQAIYLPVLTRTQKRAFIPRALYRYTIDEQGGAVYQTDDAKFQKAEADFIRARGYVSTGPSWEEQLLAPKTAPNKSQATMSAVYCGHANENPWVCTCPSNCYCKEHTCRTK